MLALKTNKLLSLGEDIIFFEISSFLSPSEVFSLSNSCQFLHKLFNSTNKTSGTEFWKIFIRRYYSLDDDLVQLIESIKNDKWKGINKLKKMGLLTHYFFLVRDSKILNSSEYSLEKGNKKDIFFKIVKKCHRDGFILAGSYVLSKKKEKFEKDREYKESATYRYIETKRSFGQFQRMIRRNKSKK